MHEFTLKQIDKLRFKPTREAEEFLEKIRRTLITGERYRAARLALARSLTEPGDVVALGRGMEMGSPIEGMHLLGEDVGIWACLVVDRAAAAIGSIDEFRQQLEAHWHRGALLLRKDFEGAGEREIEFAARIAAMVDGVRVGEGAVLSHRLGIRLGDVSEEERSGTPVDVPLNAPMISPHIAVIGADGTGKTRTAMGIAAQIVEGARIPVAWIDTTGDVVRNGALVERPEDGRTLAGWLPAVEPLDASRGPLPLDVFALPEGGGPGARERVVTAFVEAVSRGLRVRGELSLENLRTTLTGLLESGGQITFAVLRDALRESNERAGRRKDPVEQRITELAERPPFAPQLAPADFFARRWAIGLAGAPEDIQRFVILLLVESLGQHLLSLPDADTHRAGYRELRHLLVVDEATEIIGVRHPALGTLLRRGPQKGGVVVLLTQSADAFDVEAGDLLPLLGTVVAFASALRGIKNLRASFGRKLNPEDLSEREMPRGVAWAKYPPRTDAGRIVVWRP